MAFMTRREKMNTDRRSLPVPSLNSLESHELKLPKYLEIRNEHLVDIPQFHSLISATSVELLRMKYEDCYVLSFLFSLPIQIVIYWLFRFSLSIIFSLKGSVLNISTEGSAK